MMGLVRAPKDQGPPVTQSSLLLQRHVFGGVGGTHLSGRLSMRLFVCRGTADSQTEDGVS